MNDFTKRLIALYDHEAKLSKMAKGKKDETPKEEAKPDATPASPKIKNEVKDPKEKSKAGRKPAKEINWVEVMTVGDKAYYGDADSGKIKIEINTKSGPRVEEIADYDEVKNLPAGFERELDLALPNFHSKEVTKTVPSNIIVEKVENITQDMRKDVFRFGVITKNLKNLTDLLKAMNDGQKEAHAKQLDISTTIIEGVFKEFKAGNVPPEVRKFLKAQGVTPEIVQEYANQGDAVAHLTKEILEKGVTKSQMQVMLDDTLANLASAMDMYTGVHGGVLLDEEGPKGVGRIVTKLDSIIVKIKGLTPKQKIEMEKKNLTDLVEDLATTLPEGAITREKLEEKCNRIVKNNLKNVKNYTETIVLSDVEELRNEIYNLISIDVASELEASTGKGGYGANYLAKDVKELSPSPELDVPKKELAGLEEVESFEKAVKDVPTFDPQPKKEKKTKDEKEAGMLSAFDKVAAFDGAEMLDTMNDIAELLKEEYENREKVNKIINKIEKALMDDAVATEKVKETAGTTASSMIKLMKLSAFDKKAEDTPPNNTLEKLLKVYKSSIADLCRHLEGEAENWEEWSEWNEALEEAGVDTEALYRDNTLLPIRDLVRIDPAESDEDIKRMIELALTKKTASSMIKLMKSSSFDKKADTAVSPDYKVETEILDSIVTDRINELSGGKSEVLKAYEMIKNLGQTPEARAQICEELNVSNSVISNWLRLYIFPAVLESLGKRPKSGNPVPQNEIRNL